MQKSKFFPLTVEEAIRRQKAHEAEVVRLRKMSEDYYQKYNRERLTDTLPPESTDSIKIK